MPKNFDNNRPNEKHIAAAILTAGFAPILLKKKKASNVDIDDLIGLFWDVFDLMENPKYFSKGKK